MDQPEIEAVFVDALQNVAESVTELVGFEVAAISVVRDDSHLEMVAVAGSDSARAELLGRRTPIAEIEQELRSAEHWGDLLRFVPHERMTTPADQLGWVPDLVPSDDPEMWHPLDLLLVPFHDDEGELRGLLSVDVPTDRRRPAPGVRSHLQRYAAHARRSLLTGLERAELAHRVRLADAARKIVRQVSSELSIERIVSICQPAVTTGFDAAGMWIQTFDLDRGGGDAVHGATEAEIVVAEEFKVMGRAAAELLWQAQEVALVTRDTFPEIDGLTVEEEQKARLWEFMATALEATSLLFVPIGAGQECVGNMALTRRGTKDEWSLAEREAALEIGHDLGHALKNAQTFERERRLLEEVRELASYKSRLIATISHELRTPLTAVLGHLELMESARLPVLVAGSMQAVQRGAQRMRRMVEDLLVLSQVADPSRVLDPYPVDLAQVVEDVLGLLDVTLTRQELTVVFDAPDEPVRVPGDVVGLDRMCTNLIGNAAKYTPKGGTITITLVPSGEMVELSITDTGVGISPEDQERLFEEFFRSSDPEVLDIPGTGLGLAIVHRIVEQHHGTIDVVSAPGEGSTFTVSLPAKARPV
ncbi:HAMP domain-containing histidine kinase [Nocardioides seonyuensis]|uniref:histidine kinase n=1 Tax=Nocardioides seonyuensis TaxID=2518371 RepID=A0A4P7IE76_9ACTN|nr:HAMP domain-containing sensor histidine kinase [Nocardioides seonyuensis]QBX55519.1 HAMP domain-containing histidine kinase [Nocardioides seonyuensis]